MGVFTRSLQAKLLLFAFALVVIPGVVFAFMTIASARRALEEAVGRQLAEVAHDTQAEVAELLVRERQTVHTWAQQDLLREVATGDPDKRIARFLASVRLGDGAFLELLCTDVSGRVVAATDPTLLDMRYAGRDWLAAALARHEFFAGPILSDAHDHAVLEIASPILDPEREDVVIGAFLGLYDWERVAALTGRIQRNTAALQVIVDVLVLDGIGRVIAEAPPMHGAGYSGQDLRTAGWRAAQQPLPSTDPGFLHEQRPAALVGFATVQAEQPAWTVLVTLPLHEALAPVYRLQRRLLLLLAGVLLAALGVAMFLAERVTRPLRELTDATKEIATARATRRPVPVRSRDEIGHLAEAFNTMAAQLAQAQDDLVTAAKFAFVGEVAAGVAHEVRTPLGILRSSAQILGRSLPLDRPQTAELVEMLIGEVDRIDRVVEQLLELARPHEPIFEPTPLAAVLARALDFVEGQARERGIIVHREFGGDQRPARCDPDQIYQVALNLIVNALQILPRGGAISVRTLAGRDGRVSFEVRDNGPGMPAEVRERIFAPFFTMRKGGTGLGLALVQRVVQAHQGTVSVDSRVGEGTTFRVELPAAEGTR